MDKVSLTINDVRVEAEKGFTVLQAAREAGIYIPTLCSRPDLSLSLGSCRLCVVEMEGGESRFPSSCMTPVAEGMKVLTNTPLVQEIRRQNLITVLAPLPSPRLKRAELKKLAAYIGVREEDVPTDGARNLPVDRSEPLFELDQNRCILCGLCVRACKDVRGVGAMGFRFREGRLAVGPYPASSLDASGCRFCGICVQVCPTAALTYKTGEVPGEEAGAAPCTYACPAEIDVPRYVRLVSQRRFAEAAAVIREKVPFPAVLGQVCPHPCEEKCLRGQLNEPVSIAGLKRAATERDSQIWRAAAQTAAATGKRVAVVGSGPAGLTAAYYLAKLGHAVTVFEQLPKAGGMMQVGIPAYRLPRTVLLAEVEEINRVGVEIKTNTKVERAADLLKEGYDAVLLAVGTHKALQLNVPGKESKGIIEAISLLRDINLGKETKFRGKVGVIGGGSVAVDAARASLRLGAKEVQLVCLESREEMPAYEEEIRQAVEEGVRLNCSWGVKRIVAERGKVSGIDCIRCISVFDDHGKFNPRFDETRGTSFQVGTLIVAIGQVPDLSFLGEGSKVQSTRGGTIEVKEDFRTDVDGIFAAGDAVSGPGSVIQAIAMGKKAAASIDRHLGGEGILAETLVEVEEAGPCLGPSPGFAHLNRVPMPCLPVEQRIDFVEVETGFTEQMAEEEASRCLQCQLRFQMRAVEVPPVK
jgi:formate dehydrogenase (NADP+) beta subunit